MTAPQKKRAAHFHQMAERLRKLEVELHYPWAGERAVPPEWTTIAQRATTGHKARVTLWVEEDVLRFFRATGPLYTTRMAEVLSTFMHARLAGVVKGPEEVSYTRFILPTPEITEAEADRAAERLERLVAEMEAEMKRKGKG
jgi:uncharacterized protein (DUF4415 family)